MKRKEIMIDLMRRSDRADLTCSDGEVESFVGVEWLEEDSQLPDGKNPDQPSGSTSSESSEWVWHAALHDEGIGFPPGSRLLALHRPPGDEERRMWCVVLQANGAIATRGMSAADAVVNVAIWPESRLGQLRRAATSGNHILLLGSKGVAWMLFDPSESAYSLLESLPEAPQMEYSALPAHLEGYTRVAGNYPEITVEADLSRLQTVPGIEAVTAWLSQGDATAVGRDVKECVYEAVGQGIDRYMAEARSEGFFLMPVAVAGAFGTALPTAVEVIDTGYQPPYARLASWLLKGTTLQLKVEFSLRPVEVTCGYTLTSLQRQWRQLFQELRVCMGEEVEWRVMTDSYGRLTSRPVALTSLAVADGGGRAFRFSSRSRSEVIAIARNTGSLRVSASVVLTRVNSGLLTLRQPSPSGTAWTPDYTDFLPLHPDCMAATDEGVVLAQGSTVMVAMKENGVVYRYRTFVADSPILAICQASLRRGSASASRHSLYLFSRDGIRQLTSDGDGGYQNARLVSRTPLYTASSDGRDSERIAARVAAASDGVIFMTRRGLQSLTLAGSVRDHSADAPAEASPANSDRLLYDHQADIAFICGADGTYALYDMQRSAWCTPQLEGIVAIREPLGFEGTVYMVDSLARLCRVTFERREVPIDTDDDKGSSSGGNAIPPPPGQCRVVTRPMKLGNPFIGKRLIGVTTAIPMRLTIQGSDDLSDWITLYDGTSPIRGLHPCAFRYHRLILIAASSHSGHLHRLQLTYTV